MWIGGSSKVTVVGPIEIEIIFIDNSLTYELISSDFSLLYDHGIFTFLASISSMTHKSNLFLNCVDQWYRFDRHPLPVC